MENISSHLAGPVEKDSRVTQAELALRRNLRAGSWQHFMPGIRALAETFNVSPATMVKAVDRVRNDGWISNTTARQRFTIHRDVILEHKGKDSMLRTLLFLAPRSNCNETTHSTTQVLLHLWELLAPKGWNIRFHLDDYSNGKRRQKQWDDLLNHEKPQAVVAILGTPALAAWARDTKIPTFFCGGSLSELTVPIAGVSSSKMLENAMDRLIALGHKNISLMLANRSPEFCQKMQTTMRTKLTQAGVAYTDAIHAPTSKDESAEAYRQSLIDTFKEHRATAIICLDWREYIAAVCLTQELNLHVPRELSMICLSHDHSADWFKPRPSHFRHPLDDIVETLANWIDDINAHTNYNLKAYHPGIWEEGETIGLPPTE